MAIVLVVAGVIGSATYACTIGFDVGSPYGLSQLPAVPGEPQALYADDTDAYYPHYEQQCETPYGLMQVFPWLYDHYHLGFEDPVDCFAQPSGNLGHMVNGTCVAYNPLTEHRNMTPHDHLDTPVMVSTFNPNADWIKLIMNVTSVAPNQAEVCLYADVVPAGNSVGWYCWNLGSGRWSWWGLSGFRFNEISFGATAASAAPSVFDEISFSQV